MEDDDQKQNQQIEHPVHPVVLEDLSEEELSCLYNQIEIIQVGRKKALWMWSKRFYELPLSIFSPLIKVQHYAMKLIWSRLVSSVRSLRWALQGNIVGVRVLKKDD